jgi:hypothetical protein
VKNSGRQNTIFLRLEHGEPRNRYRRISDEVSTYASMGQ